jgi:hypothetical protein
MTTYLSMAAKQYNYRNNDGMTTRFVGFAPAELCAYKRGHFSNSQLNEGWSIWRA